MSGVSYRRSDAPPTECPTCTIAETRTVYTGCGLGGLRGSRRALHPGRAFAQEPALEFAARDHNLPRPSAYRGWFYRPWRRSRPRGAVGAAAPPGTGGTL